MVSPINHCHAIIFVTQDTFSFSKQFKGRKYGPSLCRNPFMVVVVNYGFGGHDLVGWHIGEAAWVGQELKGSQVKR